MWFTIYFTIRDRTLAESTPKIDGVRILMSSCSQIYTRSVGWARF